MNPPSPGRLRRRKISLLELQDMFPDEAAAERWFIRMRWPNGVACPRCGSLDIQPRRTRKPQPYRCRDCRRDFSIRTGTVMECSNVKLRRWAIAFFLISTESKGRSSLKLAADLGVTQRTAWHMLHRIRETWRDRQGPRFRGPVETDETFVGGRRRNMHAERRARLTGRGTADKAIVAGLLDRTTNRVSAAVVSGTNAKTLMRFIGPRINPAAMVYSDGEAAYRKLPRHREVNHSAGIYVRGSIHTNGIESFWATFKRAFIGVYHSMSVKHLDRYVAEFQGRHNQRRLDTIDRLRLMIRNSEGRRLRYRDLVGDAKEPNHVPTG